MVAKLIQVPIRRLERLRDRLVLASRSSPSGCVEWQHALHAKGYGITCIWVNGKNKTVLCHRLAYFLFVGGFQHELHVLHHCDNPRCIKPAHLWLGTNADNVADKMAKGREAYTVGEANANSKLSAEDVRAIRRLLADGAEQKSLAAQYSVSTSCISNLSLNKTWKETV